MSDPIIKIGDWELTITKKDTFNPKPGDDTVFPQKINTYSFHHIPTGFTMPRTIHFIEDHNEERTLEVLTRETSQMKERFVNLQFPEN